MGLMGFALECEKNNQELKQALKYYKNQNVRLKKQQKEFIKWLEKMSRMYQDEYKDRNKAVQYNYILYKYKQIIGVSNEKKENQIY